MRAGRRGLSASSLCVPGSGRARRKWRRATPAAAFTRSSAAARQHEDEAVCNTSGIDMDSNLRDRLRAPCARRTLIQPESRVNQRHCSIAVLLIAQIGVGRSRRRERILRERRSSHTSTSASTGRVDVSINWCTLHATRSTQREQSNFRNEISTRKQAANPFRASSYTCREHLHPFSLTHTHYCVCDGDGDVTDVVTRRTASKKTKSHLFASGHSGEERLQRDQEERTSLHLSLAIRSHRIASHCGKLGSREVSRADHSSGRSAHWRTREGPRSRPVGSALEHEDTRDRLERPHPLPSSPDLRSHIALPSRRVPT